VKPETLLKYFPQGRFSIVALVKRNLIYVISLFSRVWFGVGRERPRGSCFTSRSARGGLMMGFERGWCNLLRALADDGRQGLRPLRTHLARRPREDSFLPQQNSLASDSAVGGSCGLRYDRGRTVAPAELGAVNPHAV
jgi:hypothetical protein